MHFTLTRIPAFFGPTLAALALCATASAQVITPTQAGNVSTENLSFSPYFLTLSWDSGAKNVGLLQFDLSGFSTPVISAKLDIYQANNSFSSSEPAQFDIFRNLSSWSPDITDWSLLPAVDSSSAASLTIADSSEGLFREWDITALVNGWIEGTYANYGIRLERTDADNPYIYFAGSANAADIFAGALGPQLSIVSPVPEPATYGIFATAALLGLVALRRRRRA